MSWASDEGAPSPLGCTWVAEEGAYNFALYSKHATDVRLLLFVEDELSRPAYEIHLDHLRNKSGRIWHCRVRERSAPGAAFYAYRVDGPPPSSPFEWHRFDREKLLLDPYARQVHFPAGFDRAAASRPGSNLGQAPLGVLSACRRTFPDAGEARPRHENDLVVYELHVRGFTASPTAGVAPRRRGTFAGLVDKIPYLVDLGITAVELMPVFQLDPAGRDVWGYMPLAFFAPEGRYASGEAGRSAVDEFRWMVRCFHEAGIEVLLDVVFNHTCEGDERGPTYSFRGIDNSTYYLLTGNPQSPYANFSGTGNTLHCNNRYVRKMILDSLHFWAREMRVDGFRFDLASTFTRNADGSLNLDDPPIVGAIGDASELAASRLIAEPWDAGSYALGRSFPGLLWGQWNGRFRDDLRRLVRGDPGMVGSVMTRLYGSDDLFPDRLEDACRPLQSVNYVTSHDGFTLYDLVSYDAKRNWANGEGNRDGPEENLSWNCGFEGDDGVPAGVVELRKRQAKNFCALVLLANGTPMLRGGDEFLNSQGGNNNPYNQDNETGWIDWRGLDRHPDILRFFRLMIAFRQAHPSLCRSRFWRDDVRWFGAGREVDLSPASRHFAFHLRGETEGDADIYVLVNMEQFPVEFGLQVGSPGDWLSAIDTGLPSPDDIRVPGAERAVAGPGYRAGEHSVVVLLHARERSSRPDP